MAQALDLLLRIGQINPQATTIGVFTLALIVGLLWLKALQRFASSSPLPWRPSCWLC